MDKRCIYMAPESETLERLQALHDVLYSALPAGLLSGRTFVPHLTFGQCREGQDGEGVLEEAARLLPFKGRVRRIVLERIGEAGVSIVEHESLCG